MEARPQIEITVDVNKTIKAQIKGYRNLKDVQIEGKKIVLFGPNGDGKSNIIKAIGKHIGLGVVYIDECRAYYRASNIDTPTPLPIDACKKEFAFKDPELVAKVNDELMTLRYGWSIYYDKTFIPGVQYDGKWVDASELSYGELRTILLISATKFAKKDSIILIDAFEAGLHYDWIVGIMDLLTVTPQPVILESHSGFTLEAALNRGWNLYYIKEGKSKQILDLRDAGTFAIEAEAYMHAHAHV